MPSERIQRRIDQLLDEADQAIAAGDWQLVQARALQVQALDPGNSDALAYQASAQRGLAQLTANPAGGPVAMDTAAAASTAPRPPPLPEAFAGGRYRVLGLLGEGG